MRGDRQVDLHLGRVLAHLAGELADRFGHHLDVEVEADRGDVTRLLGAEQVARAADLEVAHRDLETRTEIGELADRLQPFVRLLGERAVGRVQQVRVRALTAASDAAAQLVELREPEHVGAVDHQRVDGRHVETALDDRRAHEHVVLVLPELLHDALEPALVHLPVRDRDARFGNEPLHVVGDVRDVVHAVVHVEHLTFAQQLAPDRLATPRARRTR